MLARINPLLKTTTLGFIIGTSIPIMFTNLYLIPSQNYKTEKDLNLLKNWINLMKFDVWNLEQRQNPRILIKGGDKVFSGESAYRDALYWAGF